MRCPATAGCQTCLIAGQGDSAADGMIVGEAGGATEHATSRPFSGKTGVVLTAYLKAAGLARPDLLITNLYPFWPGPEKSKATGNRDPTPGEIAAEQWRLEADIERVQPKVIAAVGRLATRWFLGDIDITAVNAQPRWSDRAPGVCVVPVVHPAAGFYEPTMAALSQAGFLAFAHFLKNPVPRLPAPRFRYVLHEEPPEWIEGAVDTEGLVDDAGPWGVSWSDGKTNHVYVWRRGDRPPKLRGRIIFHNALHDLAILRAMGIETAGLDYDDTMIGLYNLQLEPQGLKPASFRFLNLKMHDFDGVVRPHFDRLAVRWLKEAAAKEYPAARPIPIADFQKKKDRLYRPKGIGARLQSALKSHEKDPTKKGLEKRWAEIGQTQWVDRTEEYQAAVMAKMDRPFPAFSIHCVPIKKAVRYSGQDAGATARLHQKLQPILKERGLSAVYEMDRKALPFVDRMQQVGMRVEVPLLRQLEADLEAGREKAARRIRQIVGNRWFNPGSGDQVARWLYEVRGLPVLSHTDSGRGSTNEGALQMLKGYHAQDPEVADFITSVQDYREHDKLDGTFVKPAFLLLRRDPEGNWRLHSNFRVTRVVSGRLSSHDLNVLALPSRTALGKRIRECFVAGDGWVLIDADLSQAELRVLSDRSGDRTMLRAFQNNEDLHILTASQTFKRPVESFGKDSVERYASKILNFSLAYGVSARALLELLYESNIFTFTLADCERFIREWYRIYSGIRPWQVRVWEQAADQGYVEDMWGRRCYVPNLRVMDERLREAAQRLAGNFPIQSAVSGLVKRAEVRVYDWIEDAGLREEARPWLQMHDELLLEVKEERAEEVRRYLQAAMTADQGRFRVPLKADATTGRSWAEAK